MEAQIRQTGIEAPSSRAACGQTREARGAAVQLAHTRAPRGSRAPVHASDARVPPPAAMRVRISKYDSGRIDGWESKGRNPRESADLKHFVSVDTYYNAQCPTGALTTRMQMELR